MASGLGVLVWTGIISSSKSPPSTPELGVLLTGAAVLQVAAGVTFGKVGHVDSDKARSAVRRLITIGFSLRLLRTITEAALSQDDDVGLRTVVIRTDQGLRDISSHVVDAIADWTDVHSEALQNVVSSAEEQQRKLDGAEMRSNG